MLIHKLFDLITSFLNFVFQIFGVRYDETGRLVGHHVWMHWQNLNEDTVDPRREFKAKGWPYHGRAWLKLWGRKEIGWSWSLWSHFCHAGIEIEPSGDHVVQFSLALPPISLWLHFNGFLFNYKTRSGDWWQKKYGYHGREVQLSVHDWTLWWKVWADPHEWHSTTPKWQDGCLHVLDFILGKSKHSEVILSTDDVLIPMPEGAYPAKVKLKLGTWKRPRWFAHRFRLADIDVDIGIPFQGKGENSWDCGEDAAYGLGCPAKTLAEAVSAMTASVLRSRQRYDGDVMAKYPPVPVRVEAVTARRKLAQEENLRRGMKWAAAPELEKVHGVKVEPVDIKTVAYNPDVASVKVILKDGRSFTLPVPPAPDPVAEKMVVEAVVAPMTKEA